MIGEDLVVKTLKVFMVGYHSGAIVLGELMECLPDDGSVRHVARRPEYRRRLDELHRKAMRPHAARLSVLYEDLGLERVAGFFDRRYREESPSRRELYDRLERETAFSWGRFG